MKSNIYYIGDSWNEFPKHIENRVDDYLLYHGAGIEKVWQSSKGGRKNACLLYTSPSPRDRQKSRMPSSA